MYWLLFGIVILIAVNVGMYSWFGSGQGSLINSVQKTLLFSDDEPQNTVIYVPPVLPEPVVDEQAAPPSVPTNNEFDQPVAVEQPLPEQTLFYGQVPDFSELAGEIRAQLPPLELTGHLYSLAHAHARKVIINGTALREQQYAADNLLVKEITPDGVVFDFKGRVFKLNATQMFR